MKNGPIAQQRVDFPAPVGPITPRNSPGSIAMEILFRASFFAPLYLNDTPCNSMIGIFP